MAEIPITLNPGDPFEDVISEIVALNRRKRADYARDTDPWSNFRETAAMVSGFGHDFGAIDAVLFNIAQKIVRLQALATNGRPPANEAVSDTWKDMAVYSIIGLILAREAEEGPQEPGPEPAPARRIADLGDVFHYGDVAPGPEVLELTGAYPHHGTIHWVREGDYWRWWSSNRSDSGAHSIPWCHISHRAFPLTVSRVED